MKHYDLKETKKERATFYSYDNGYYTFILENEDAIVFEEINKSILDQYNLRDVNFKNQKFIITYTEIVEDEDDEDMIIYRLEKLEQL